MKLTKRSENWLKKLEKTLLKHESLRLINLEPVEVGYRTSCGCKDQTLNDFEVFSKFIKALRSQGIIINETHVKHKNRYASNNGGFWNSYIYEIKD